MKYNGFVINFGSYTPSQLEQMKKDLDLSMPTSMLHFCASYFKKQEKHDPAIEEIQLLDLLFKTLNDDPSALAPTELMTNDACVAETYADMMQKRNELFPTAKTPCSLREAFGIATAYLQRAGKQADFTNRLAFTERRAEPSVHQKTIGAIPISQTGVCLHQIHKNDTRLSNDDLILLLLPSPTENPANYDTLITKLLTSPPLIQNVKQLRKVGNHGLLYEFIQWANGAMLSLPHLSRLGEEMPLSMLVNAYEGKLLVRIDAESADDFAADVRTLGLRAMQFASITTTPRITVIQEDKRRFSWSIDFLRALCPIHPTSVRLANEAFEADAPIHHLPVSTEDCKNPMCSPTREFDTYYDGSVLTAVAASRPQKDFFRNALDTVLTAVLTLAASGCHYSEQRLAVALTLPKRSLTPLASGEGVSTVLGVYRLQVELGIPLIADHPEAADDLEHPSLTVFAMANGAPCPIRLQGEGNRIFCIMPQIQGDGTPCFRLLRNLLEYLAELRNRGVLQSARVLSRESITDALAQMRTDALSCRFTGDAWASQGKLPLAILIEVSEPIPTAKEVARVVKRVN